MTEAEARQKCRDQGTAQCAAICLQYTATFTRDGQCPEALLVWSQVEAKRPRWKWHDFLTPDEFAIVQSAEQDSADAKAQLARATARLNPIRNRAIHRAKCAQRNDG